MRALAAVTAALLTVGCADLETQLDSQIGRMEAREAAARDARPDGVVLAALADGARRVGLPAWDRAPAEVDAVAARVDAGELTIQEGLTVLGLSDVVEVAAPSSKDAEPNSARAATGLRMEGAVAVWTPPVAMESRALLAQHEALMSAAPSAVVIDLRGHEGGPLSWVGVFASLFLDGGVVGQQRTRDGVEPLLAEPGYGTIKAPLAVLIDGATSGGAELIAAALQSRGRAVVIGEPSAGDAEIRTLVDHGAGRLFLVRTGWMAGPDGRSFADDGVIPDERASPGRALSAALEALAVE